MLRAVCPLQFAASRGAAVGVSLPTCGGVEKTNGCPAALAERVCFVFSLASVAACMQMAKWLPLCNIPSSLVAHVCGS